MDDVEETTQGTREEPDTRDPRRHWHDEPARNHHQVGDDKSRATDGNVRGRLIGVAWEGSSGVGVHVLHEEEEHRGGEYPLELTQTGEADVASYGGCGAGGCVGDIPVLAAPHLVVGVRGDGGDVRHLEVEFVFAPVQRPRGGVEVERERGGEDEERHEGVELVHVDYRAGRDAGDVRGDARGGYVTVPRPKVRVKERERGVHGFAGTGRGTGRGSASAARREIRVSRNLYTCTRVRGGMQRANAPTRCIGWTDGSLSEPVDALGPALDEGIANASMT